MKAQQKYICPPKLQSKLLVGLWTIPELLVIVVVLVAGFYVANILIGIAAGLAICTARIDREHSIIGYIVTRVLFFYRAQIYRNM